MNFTLHMPRALRIAVLILAIVATLGVSAASSSPAHNHAGQPANGCDICITAHLVSIAPQGIVHLLQAPDVQGRLTQATALAGYCLLRSSASVTRGPPSFLL
jgi:hypothetical protein